MITELDCPSGFLNIQLCLAGLPQRRRMSNHVRTSANISEHLSWAPNGLIRGTPPVSEHFRTICLLEMFRRSGLAAQAGRQSADPLYSDKLVGAL